MRRNLSKLPVALLLAGTTLAAGCVEDATDLARPDTEVERLFARYVALGNSITAGIQSAGLTPESQAAAYPVLLAAMADANFNIPLVNAPGCPPPLAQPFPLGTATTAPGVPCALRATPVGPVQNLAVPGANVTTIIDNLADSDATSSFNRLQTFILGGRSQVAALKALDPTLVTAWIGNNDALGLVFNGLVGTELTPLPDFQRDFARVVEAIDSENPQGVVLIGVVNPLLVPVLQPGAYFFALRQAGQFPKPVNANCSPVTATGQPNPLARNLVTFFVADPKSPVPEVNCDPARFGPGSPFLIDPAEIGMIQERVAGFNQTIKAAADANGWIYVDPNALLLPFLADPNKLRKCQGLATATTLATFQAAVVTTCPNPTAPNFFGSLISFDGIHPSSEAHVLIAAAVAEALEAKFAIDL